jgi:hypothetical protein
MPTALDTNDARKLAAWRNAIPTADPNIRTDWDRREIWWSEYGRYTEHGWQIDHFVPRAFGGSDRTYNLRARHWRGSGISFADALARLLAGK